MALIPFRAAASKPAKKAYLGTVLLITTSIALLCISTIAYWLFYYNYVPQLSLERVVHLQFGFALTPLLLNPSTEYLTLTSSQQRPPSRHCPPQLRTLLPPTLRRLRLAPPPPNPLEPRSRKLHDRPLALLPPRKYVPRVRLVYKSSGPVPALGYLDLRQPNDRYGKSRVADAVVRAGVEEGG